MPQKKGTPGAKTRRRHGYRGYGSGFDRGFGGSVHWGRGFSGIGSPGESGAMTLPRSGMFEDIAGPYAGRAPIGYERSDERIREEICEELTRRPDIDPSRLTVSVADGEVRLEGAVEDLESRRLADEIATRCTGVRQVHNVLRVESTGKKKP
jgi:BON domain-containing protein